MIRFHKVLHGNLPTTFNQNEQHIWFTDEGSLFVGDANGVPRQMSLGYKEVVAVPSGVPAAPGLVRYASSTDKYYLSTETSWIELTTQAQDGSSMGAGYAGGVVVIDSPNNYVSGDVEGVLAEIGAAISPLVGTKQLKDYTDNVFGLVEAGEWNFRETATNRPDSNSGDTWAIQRKTSRDNILGLVVGDNGVAHLRINETYERVLTQKDKDEMDLAAFNTSSDLNGLRISFNSRKVNVGEGLLISNDGLIKDNPTISFKDPLIKKGGDDVLGSLTFKNTAALKFSTTGDNVIEMKSGRAGSKTARIVNNEKGFSIQTIYAGDTKSVAPLYYNVADHRLYLNYNANGNDMSHISAKGIVAKGPFHIEKDPIFTGSNEDRRHPENSQATQYALYVDHGTTGQLIVARGSNAQLAIRNPRGTGNRRIRFETTYQYRQSGDKTSMEFTGRDGVNMKNFQVNAINAGFTGHVSIGHKLVIGNNHPYRSEIGDVSGHNRIVLHAVRGRGGLDATPTTADRRNVARIGYYRSYGSRQRDEVHFHSLNMGSDKTYAQSTWSHNYAMTVVAERFRASQFENASSIVFKENVEKYTEDALSIVKNLDVFKYNYKDDKDKNETVGFIIEKGVPEIAVTSSKDALDPYAMTAILWKAVKELSAEVERLKK